MAETLKVLGQVAPAAATDTAVYTVGAGRSASISTVQVCNTGATAATWRLAVRVAGAVLAPQSYLFYDVPVAVSQSISVTIGITLAATDVLSVRASTADVAFNVFGAEVS